MTAKTVFPILAAISFCHLLNDLVQSLIPALYPILKDFPSTWTSGKSDSSHSPTN